MNFAMSKAFTREDDDDEGTPAGRKPARTLPGGKNYITPQGYRRLDKELKQLRDIERPEVTKTVTWAASLGDRSENADYQYGKRRLREIDRRLHEITKKLQSAVVVDPTKITAEDVRFGATVAIADEEGEERTFMIVGVDEVAVEKGRISWVSPLGAALLKAKVGDWVTYQTPKGKQEVEILSIQYLALEEEG